jgi:hypothetical protein
MSWRLAIARSMSEKHCRQSDPKVEAVLLGMSQDNLTPSAIARNYSHQLVETTRKKIALERMYPGFDIIRFKRAAVTGPNSVYAVLFLKAIGERPVISAIPYARIERAAEAVPDEEVFEKFDRHALKDASL